MNVHKAWQTVNDDRVRAEHLAAQDEAPVPINAPFEVGGFLADYPGDPSLPPDLRINCRCVVVLVDETGEPLVGTAQLSQGDDEDDLDFAERILSSRFSVALSADGAPTDELALSLADAVEGALERMPADATSALSSVGFTPRSTGAGLESWAQYDPKLRTLLLDSDRFDVEDQAALVARFRESVGLSFAGAAADVETIDDVIAAVVSHETAHALIYGRAKAVGNAEFTRSVEDTLGRYGMTVDWRDRPTQMSWGSAFVNGDVSSISTAAGSDLWELLAEAWVAVESGSTNPLAVALVREVLTP